MGTRSPGDCCSPSCGFEAATTVCRPAAGDCDLAETCDGAARVRPTRLRTTICPATTAARARRATCCRHVRPGRPGHVRGVRVPRRSSTVASRRRPSAVTRPGNARLRRSCSAIVRSIRAIGSRGKRRGQATTGGGSRRSDRDRRLRPLSLRRVGPHADARVPRRHRRAGRAEVPACWRRVESGGTLRRFKYSDCDRTPDGLATMSVAPGTDGRARLVVAGRGVLPDGRPFGFPAPPLGLPLRAQLLRAGGACWEAAY